MSSPILATKLYIPSLRPGVVERSRLIERLNEGLQRKLTLISAPAGFGKSTLVSERVSDCSQPIAWLSLDEADSAPSRFLTYLVAALQNIADCGATALAALKSPQPPPIEFILTILLNEVSELPENSLLVLDDYHLIDAKAIDDALTFFLQHSPPQIHLVIATREDPQLSLSRLRARGQMTEIRAADLRFMPAEVSEFLNQTMGLNLSEQDIAALELRTEGWIVGLQMAAVSLQGRSDRADFIQAFTGSHRFIIDYLLEEVLRSQNKTVRDFLLQTSILDRLCGPLCEAVTQQTNSVVMLESLERDNLFLVPLDDQRRWYRYHHLFADVLRTQLMQPDQTSALHLRASDWFDQNHYPSNAIQHALAAGDFDRAAALIELAWPDMRKHHPEAVFLDWMQVFPEEYVRVCPVLNTYYGFALLSSEFESGHARICEAERWREQVVDKSTRAEADAKGMIVVNEAESHALPGMISIAHAYHAGALGDQTGIVMHAQQALERLPEGDTMWRGSAAALLGIAHWVNGDLQAAHQSIAQATVSMQKAEDASAAISTLYVMADIQIAKGQLREASRTCQKALRLVSEHGDPAPQGTADIYVLLSELYLEQGDLENAAQQLIKSRGLGEHARLLEPRHRWYIAMARIKQAQGDMDSAHELLDEAKEKQMNSPVPDVRPVAAWKTRVLVAQNRLSEALEWMYEQKLTANDERSYLLEFEHITLARLLIAQYQNEASDCSIQQAMELLERLEKAAEAGQRKGSLIEILLLQALAQQARGNTPDSIALLQQALSLAETAGYFQIFVTQGPAMNVLLNAVAKQDTTSNYIRRLVTTCGEHAGKSVVNKALIEPLSARELDVLKLLGSDLSGPEIASQLFVSLNTMRTHTKNIYHKLGVNNRRAAVHRAEEIGLL